MPRYAFKVFYNGKNYSGYQRQPNGLGVENYLEDAFISAGYIKSFYDNNYKGTSRTDRYVNAVGNVFALNCDREPNLSMINHYLPTDRTIILWGWAQVSNLFNPREVLFKEYNYLLYNIESKFMRKINRIYRFLGEHNFSRYIKKEGAGAENPISNIMNIKLTKISEKSLLIKITGNKFGREQIRRMVGYLIEDKYLNTQPDEFLIDGDPLNIKPVDGDNLYLMRIEYSEDINWNFDIEIQNLVYRELEKIELKKEKIEFLGYMMKNIIQSNKSNS